MKKEIPIDLIDWISDMMSDMKTHSSITKIFSRAGTGYFLEECSGGIGYFFEEYCKSDRVEKCLI